MLLMMEDNADRIQRFTTTLRSIDSSLPFHVWRNAWSMIREMDAFLPAACLISLDHDLEPGEGNSDDPGTGWDLTKHLAALTPSCPIIMHTSNSERATWMMGEFEIGGWPFHRVAPIGDDWIEQDWRLLVQRLVKRRSR
jgi:hypothetical protein